MSWLITLILLTVFSTPITNIIINTTTLDDKISDRIEINLKDTFSGDIEEGNAISTDDSNISNSFASVINNYIEEAKQSGAESISKYVADKIAYIAIYAIVLLILFILARFVSMLIKYTLEFIVRLPLLCTFNRIGGVIYGVIRAFLIVYIVLAIISLLSPMLADSNIIALIKSSHIASIFYNNNIILNLLTK